MKSTKRNKNDLSASINCWKEYKLSELYRIQRGNGFSRSSFEEASDGINFISRQSYNNGINCIVKEIENITPFPAGCITIALGGAYLGSAFIQPAPFYTAAHIAVLFPKHSEMTFNVNLFICSLIRFESTIKYCAFGRELDTYVDNRFTICLPHKKDGSPDWAWIENYMSSIEKGIDQQINELMITADGDNNIIKIFAEKVEINEFKEWLNSHSSIEKGTPLSLDDIPWKEYRIGSIFRISRGQRFISDDHEPGSTLFCSASDKNNGVTDCISNPLFVEKDALIYSTFGDCYYVEGTFTASDEISILKNEKLNKNNGFFIATVLSANKYKYQFVRKAFQNKFINETIYLPTSQDGSPNWEWMDKYVQSLPYSD